MATRTQRHALIALVCCLLAQTVAAQASHVLDGKAFTGKNGEQGQPLDPNQDEEFVFKDGRFTSLSCAPYEFGSGEYSARLVDDAIHFEATTLSPTHGKIVWKGVVKGNTAAATFVWTKERWYWNTRRQYWFEGTLKE